MYSYDKVINGISKYIDLEIIDKIPGWKKWVVGSGAGIMLSNSSNIFEQIKDNAFIKMLNIIDENDNVNVEALYKEFKKQAQKGGIDIELPMIGSFMLNEQDVDKLYRLIVNE